MGLLSDIYSWGDTKKRELKGLLADPVGMLEKTVGQLQDSAKERSSLMNQAGWGITSPSTATPEQQRIAQQILADQGAQQAMAAATVWHGSPHKFDKFDSSKIGTGEGAQAYGHGLYLAESPDVAGSYAKMGFSPNRRANDMAESLYLDRWNTVRELEKQKAAGVTRFGVKWDGIWDRRLSEALADAAKRGPRPENLYKVDLPDEHIAKMLDWDKPLSQQAPEVRAAVMATKKQLTPDDIENLGGAGAVRALYDPANKIDNFLGTWESLRGKRDAGETLLRQHGIPGIRYLDGGSRGTGQGTSNFVVFPGNEGLLKILERNGQALK